MPPSLSPRSQVRTLVSLVCSFTDTPKFFPLYLVFRRWAMLGLCMDILSFPVWGLFTLAGGTDVGFCSPSGLLWISGKGMPLEGLHSEESLTFPRSPLMPSLQGGGKVLCYFPEEINVLVPHSAVPETLSTGLSHLGLTWCWWESWFSTLWCGLNWDDTRYCCGIWNCPEVVSSLP